MPPKKSPTSKEAAPTPIVEVEHNDEICPICIQPILEASEHENGHDALLCEGRCKSWYHHWCTGVSNVRYASLSASDQPFLCPSCVAEQQAHVVQELQSMVCCLAEEVHELKAAVAVLQSSNSASTSARPREGATSNIQWSTVVSRDKRPALHVHKQQVQVTGSEERPVKPDVAGNRQSEKKQRWHSVKTLPMASAKHRKANVSSPKTQPCDRSTGPRQDIRQVVDGVRRVWGTMRSCTPRTLLSTLQRVTTVAEHVEVRRKFKVKGNTEIRWWFHIQGEPANPSLPADATSETSPQVPDQLTTGLPQVHVSNTGN